MESLLQRRTALERTASLSAASLGDRAAFSALRLSLLALPPSGSAASAFLFCRRTRTAAGLTNFFSRYLAYSSGPSLLRSFS